MTFHIITLFPETIEPYLKSSIVGRALKRGLVKIKYYNPVDFTTDKHRKVDDRPYGGGPGMVLQLEPLIRTVQAARKIIDRQKARPKGARLASRKLEAAKIVLFSPSGKQFTNASVNRLAKSNSHLILICGRYEGIDERIKKVLRGQKLGVEELSIGPYVLTGGELPAMVLVDATCRHLKGVLGKEESLEEKRLGIGVPVYTRPEIFSYRNKKYKVPQVLLTGDHAKIEAWRKKHKKVK
ncbi:MAG: tRNA (guanosine(37)-N1)-methyltransferase TrmD [Candidatus Colwellbacteria bacterium]|nr:tRNA (guanosine(37)-N1)-methyltransferase TrmD [Candidatus Colwellbacteria bacterium]